MIYNNAGSWTATSQLFFNDTSNYLGLGTTSPTHRLQLADHTTAAGGIGLGADVELYRSAANTLRLASGDSFIITSGAFTTSGGVVNINNNSNYTTNINTGTSTGTVSIGGGSNQLVINSSTWDISGAGIASGFTGLSSSGNIDFSSLSSGGK